MNRENSRHVLLYRLLFALAIIVVAAAFFRSSYP
jgi:hypothetical protein